MGACCSRPHTLEPSPYPGHHNHKLYEPDRYPAVPGGYPPPPQQAQQPAGGSGGGCYSIPPPVPPPGQQGMPYGGSGVGGPSYYPPPQQQPRYVPYPAAPPGVCMRLRLCAAAVRQSGRAAGGLPSWLD